MSFIVGPDGTITPAGGYAQGGSLFSPTQQAGLYHMGGGAGAMGGDAASVAAQQMAQAGGAGSTLGGLPIPGGAGANAWEAAASQQAAQQAAGSLGSAVPSVIGADAAGATGAASTGRLGGLLAKYKGMFAGNTDPLTDAGALTRLGGLATPAEGGGTLDALTTLSPRVLTAEGGLDAGAAAGSVVAPLGAALAANQVLKMAPGSNVHGTSGFLKEVLGHGATGLGIGAAIPFADATGIPELVGGIGGLLWGAGDWFSHAGDVPKDPTKFIDSAAEKGTITPQSAAQYKSYYDLLLQTATDPNSDKAKTAAAQQISAMMLQDVQKQMTNATNAQSNAANQALAAQYLGPYLKAGDAANASTSAYLKSFADNLPANIRPVVQAEAMQSMALQQLMTNTYGAQFAMAPAYAGLNQQMGLINNAGNSLVSAAEQQLLRGQAQTPVNPMSSAMSGLA